MSRGMQQGKGERMKRRGKQTGAASGRGKEKKQHLTFFPFLFCRVVFCGRRFPCRLSTEKAFFDALNRLCP